MPKPLWFAFSSHAGPPTRPHPLGLGFASRLPLLSVGLEAHLDLDLPRLRASESRFGPIHSCLMIRFTAYGRALLCVVPVEDDIFIAERERELVGLRHAQLEMKPVARTEAAKLRRRRVVDDLVANEPPCVAACEVRQVELGGRDREQVRLARAAAAR